MALALDGDAAAAKEHIERGLRLDRACLSAQYAQAILNGEAGDAQGLVQRLLGGRQAPLGGTMADWVLRKEAGRE